MPGLTINSNPTKEERYLAQRRMRGVADTIFGLPDMVNTTLNAGIRDVGSLTGLYDPNKAFQFPMASQSAANLGTQLTGANIVPESEVSPEVAKKGANWQALMGMIPTGGVEDAATPTLKMIGMLAGPLAKNAPLLDLPSAKSLFKHGDDPEKIWQATGWQVDPVGQFNWEIPDINAKFKDPSKISTDPDAPSRLGDVFEHPELFENYPELADIPIHKIAADDPEVGLGFFDPGTGQIGLRFDPTGDPLIDDQLDPLGTLMHELQHAVQKKEGWDPSDSPGAVASTLFEPGSFAFNLQEIMGPQYMDSMGLDPYDPDDVNLFIHSDEYKGMLNDVTWETYRRLNAESQAETTVDRLRMPLSQLRKESPNLTSGRSQIARGPEEVLSYEDVMANRDWQQGDIYGDLMSNLRGAVRGPAEERRRRIGTTLTNRP